MGERENLWGMTTAGAVISTGVIILGSAAAVGDGNTLVAAIIASAIPRRRDPDDPRTLVRTDGRRYRVPETRAAERRGRGRRNRFGPEEAAAIRDAQAASESQRSIAARLGVSVMTVHNVVNRKRGYRERRTGGGAGEAQARPGE